MMAMLLCGLLILSPAQTTPPPTEAGEFVDAVDLDAWDDFFSRLEGTEAWQRPSALVRELAEGEDDPARLLAWLRNRSLSGLNDAAALCILSLITGVLAALLETLLDKPTLPARRVLALGLGALLLVKLLPLVRRGLACLNGVLTLAEVTVPLMTGALILLVSPQGASLMGTLGELLIHACLRFLQGALVPLALSEGVLRAADCVGDSVLTSISKVLFSLVRWGMRIVCFGYSLVAALMGAGAAGMDSLLLRSGKAAAGSLPLVGSLVSDSLGATVAVLGLVKVALGRTGLLLVTVQTMGPVAALFLHGFGLKTAASLLMSLDQREMGSLLNALGEMLTILGALILAAGAMLSVTVAGAAGCFGGGL